MVQPPPLPKTQTPKGVAELLEEAGQLVESEPLQAAALATEAFKLANRKADHKGKAEALLLLGLTSEKRADLEPARDYLIQAAKIFEQVDEPAKQQRALAYAGRVCRVLGELDRAKGILEQSLKLAEQLGDLRAKADVLNSIAGILFTEGEYRKALQMMKGVIEAHKEAANTQGYYVALGNVAALHLKVGEYSQALEKQFSVYRYYKENTDFWREAQALSNIGYIYEEGREYTKALEYYLLALTACQKSQYKTQEIAVLNNLGSIHNQLGNYKEALNYLSNGSLLAQQAGYRSEEATALNKSGRAYVGLNQNQDAIEVYLSALDISKSIKDFVNELTALLELGKLYLHLTDSKQAFDCLKPAIALAQQSNSKKALYEAHELLAEAYEKVGDYAKALEHHREFYKGERDVFNQESEQRVRNLTLRFDLEKLQEEAAFFRSQTDLEHKAKEKAELRLLQRTIQLDETQVEMLQRLASTAEYRDDDTGEHNKRVGEFAALIAQEMGWPVAKVGILRQAAPLHDLGKIGISDALLYKPGKYTDAEREEMKAHTIIGSKILASGRSEVMRMAETIALTHHERWDGKGYPKGLAGEDIPEVGRIVAVADVFDALTNIRPYKKAWSVEEALAELEKNAGAQFDPNVVKIAIGVFTKEKTT